MKTMRISLIIAVAFLMTASFSACKKDAEPEPELSASVVGNYTLTRLLISGKTYTIDAQTTGKASIARESATTVSFAMDVKSAKDPSSNILQASTDVTVEDTGKGEFNLLNPNGSLFATAGNNTLTVNVRDPSGAPDYQMVFTK